MAAGFAQLPLSGVFSLRQIADVTDRFKAMKSIDISAFMVGKSW